MDSSLEEPMDSSLEEPMDSSLEEPMDSSLEGSTSIHASFLHVFANMPDPRVERTREHALLDILFCSLCAVLCGAEDGTAIADFARARLSWLRQYVPLKSGVPSHDTFSRVLSRLSAEHFACCFTDWMRLLHERSEREVIALDGKTLRHSFDNATGKAAIHMVSAWASANGLVLGQVKVEDKSNEITAVPKLLALLDLQGCIVTLDAMGTQRTLAQQIIEQGGDYVLPVKGNQPEMQADVQTFFEQAQANQFLDAEAETLPHTFHQTIDAEHGRVEVRRCWACAVSAQITSADRWKGIKSVALIESERTVKAATVKAATVKAATVKAATVKAATVKAATTIERRYFISSLPPSARQVMQAVRAHWGIENSLHWVLDVTFREDASRTRKDNAPQNMATLRHLALNILKRNTTRKASLKRKRQMAAWETTFLTELLQN
jgi:predicted transposase YbfD/YdcC